MTRRRTDELLTAWRDVADSIERPPAARRQPTSVGPALVASAVSIIAVVVVVAVAAGLYFSVPGNQSGSLPTASPTVQPTPLPSTTQSTTPSSNPSASASAEPSPTQTGIANAPVVARIAIPFPDGQTAPEAATAVVGSSIWIADGSQSYLVRIDPVSNKVVATIPVDPSDLIAGDGALWTVSPVGMVPGPPTLTVSRIDLATNAVTATDFPEIGAAGLGSLWAISIDGGLLQINPATGHVDHTWSNIKGNSVEVGCGSLWIRTTGQTLARFDPATGRLGQPIDVSRGAGRVHDTAAGCYVVLGNPGGYPVDEGGTIALIDGTGIVNQSPTLHGRVHIAGNSFWTSTDSGLIQRIDPSTGAEIGHAWQLPTDDLPTNPKFVDWRLMSDGSDLYLLTGSSLVHLGIPATP